MEQKQDLLIEIGTEELPPTALKRLSEAFGEGISRQLAEHELSHGPISLFATPRRLAVLVKDAASRQPDRETLRRGPALAAAFDASGAPTKAASGFARSCGVEVSDLAREETPKGVWLVYRQQVDGQPITALLPLLITHALEQLPIPKRMRWGSGDEAFVRPLHWVCVLCGRDTVPGQILGVEIGNCSRGHRFHHPDSVVIESPETYVATLRSAHVEPSFGIRREHITAQVAELAASIQGHASMPEALLDEVAALCEWPVALLGRFDRRFLEIPPEVLIETMQKNQKYFPVFGADGALLPYFITVSNIESQGTGVGACGQRACDPAALLPMPCFSGNRIASAPWRTGRRPSGRSSFSISWAASWIRRSGLGPSRDEIADELGDDADLAERAALLGKCDLVTLMVGEFASLQGIMGRYYAQHDGEDDCVVAAMEEQYLPRHAGDQLPQSPCGRALALADKLDSLVGIFAIGQRPTGVKDPYGLRRAAIGVLRIMIETPLPLDLKALLTSAARGYGEGINAAAAVDAVFEYIADRLPGYYGDRGLGGDVVDAVLATGSTSPADIDRRVLAVGEFRKLDAADALAAANKRIRNILKKAPSDAGANAIVSAALIEPAEQRLAQSIESMQSVIEPLLAAKDYAGVLSTLAELRTDVDAFFDAVMVMADDPALRANRIAILRGVATLFLTVADISRLQSPSSTS